ncbi:MAG TPA: glycine--tRNA ligase subunit beta [Peptococcaceae bacterium]|nr:MAG: Glycine--tRNA ligase beta subunit [Clostridia bacterium 41_269]HBT20274.1 glycine--tRNA ligase subunit beta [Peptococcaceae bacterium]
MPRDFLLEIGTEEIPARFMENGLMELKSKAEELFKNYRLPFKEIKTYGTPRRLVLYVVELGEHQEALREEVKGPPAKIAFDEDGNPTKAALGFARSQKVSVDSLTVKEVNGTPYVFAVHERTGSPVIEILPDVLPDLIKSLSFPVSMRWGDKDVRFVRPIRWLVSLYGSSIVEFEFAGIKAGSRSRGHRFLSKGEVVINGAEDYLEAMEKAYVLVDQNKRKEIIWDQIEKLAAEEGGMVRRDDDLLCEINYLLEYPTALCGSFPERYLSLPEEVLVTTMREHQRYFPVYSSDGRMLPKFITVRNGTDKYIEIVREGNEKVLRARLADAEFFFNEDQKTPLSEKVSLLKNVVFYEKLGTMYDKCERLKNLVDFIGNCLNYEEEVKNAARRAAFLCKADLVTNMVTEFPELQGIMGYYYAKNDGEDLAVCEAIRDHYMPRFSGDMLPKTEGGCLLSIADKIDNIVGCFSLGIQPTGSQDPYALRRQALGICRIFIEWQLDLSLSQLFKRAYEIYSAEFELSVPYEELEENLMEFFKHRISGLLEEMGFRYDIVNAVLAKGWDNLWDAYMRAEALREFRGDSHFAALLTGFTRAANLSRNADRSDINPDLLTEDAEKVLYSKYLEAKDKVENLLLTRQYLSALREISDLRNYIDNFFDEVMVMVDDEKIRENRLALLKNISQLMSSVGDLSKIVF